jgi:lipopolysaccharide transport protein LptA/LPS export ABC transporter protein LptC
MRQDRTRLARRVLLAVLVVVAGAVAWSLRRPTARPTPAGPGAAASPGHGTTVADGSLLRFREGKERIQVKFRAMVGREGDATRLSGVEVSLPFVAEGRESRATITAEDGLYQASPLRVTFRGNVHVKTDDGFELESDSLKYWGDQERVFTRDPVRFRRGGISGTAKAMEHVAGAGLSLHGEVRVRLEDGAGPPADVESASAWGSRDERIVRFEGGVVARQGARELRSQRLQLNLTPDLSSVERAAAIEDVDLVTAAGGGIPGSPASGGGTKRLQCRRLNVVFRAPGILQEALAVNSASLEIHPAPGETPEKRTISAPQLRFDFDEEGRLVSLQGLPARQTEAGAQRFALLTTEPLPPSQEPKRSVRSDRFAAAIDPLSGAVSGATFEGSVVFDEPGRRGFAGKAVYEDGPGLVSLTGDPRIVDEGEGAELRGKRIRLGTRARTVAASDSVRHTVTPKRKSARPGLLGGDEPAVLLCREFEYDPRTRTARYRENALLRSGKDEVRAPTIVIEEAANGTRRLTASGGTTSVLHPRPRKDASKPQKGATKEPAAVEARSREMVYEEAAGRVVYTGDVEIRQGDILTLSPEAVVTLTKDGGALDRLLAGEPVEVRQGERRANGQRGTYTPADERLVLVGEPVVLRDVDRRVEGRVLTFEVGSDRIRVDGREEVRTEAVFRRKEPSKP